MEVTVLRAERIIHPTSTQEKKCLLPLKNKWTSFFFLKLSKSHHSNDLCSLLSGIFCDSLRQKLGHGEKMWKSPDDLLGKTRQALQSCREACWNSHCSVSIMCVHLPTAAHKTWAEVWRMPRGINHFSRGQLSGVHNLRFQVSRFGLEPLFFSLSAVLLQICCFAWDLPSCCMTQFQPGLSHQADGLAFDSTGCRVHSQLCDCCCRTSPNHDFSTVMFSCWQRSPTGVWRCGGQFDCLSLSRFLMV